MHNKYDSMLIYNYFAPIMGSTVINGPERDESIIVESFFKGILNELIAKCLETSTAFQGKATFYWLPINFNKKKIPKKDWKNYRRLEANLKRPPFIKNSIFLICAIIIYSSLISEVDVWRRLTIYNENICKFSDSLRISCSFFFCVFKCKMHPCLPLNCLLFLYIVVSSI